jgi:hypothetical protein
MGQVRRGSARTTQAHRSRDTAFAKLRQIEVQLAQGNSLALACKEAGISEQGRDRRLERSIQPHSATLGTGRPTARCSRRAGHRTTATHTSHHAVVSQSPVQNPRQVTGYGQRRLGAPPRCCSCGEWCSRRCGRGGPTRAEGRSLARTHGAASEPQHERIS